MPTATVKKVKDEAPKLTKTVRALEGYVATVSFEGGRRDSDLSNAQIAYLNEHGSPARNVPARPFVGPGVKEALPELKVVVFHADGVVIPSGSLGIVRAAEAERQGSQITIYTMVPIQATDEAAGMIADNVVYKGSQYEVTGQDDYFEWGFNVATAVLASPGGRPALYPQQLPKLPMGGLQ
jgi:hypothetical protein